jgi:putative mRNA 3-end processing factor
MRAAKILKLTPAGLYCEAGDFYIDPVKKVPRALITHGHSDHARSGHDAVLATAATLAVMAERYGPKFAANRQALRYGETAALGDARVTFRPAGHILGSAQIVVEAKGGRVVVSGDYKRGRDPTCPPFEPIPCDIFISEATFGLPVFRHPPAEQEVAKLLRSLALFPDRAHFIGAYSLGKAQRLIALLRQAGYREPLFVDAATMRLCSVYAAHDVMLGDLRPREGQPAHAMIGKIAVGASSFDGEFAAKGLPAPITSFASGWMRLRKRARQAQVDLPLIISDHADWDELTRTIREIAPGELWITHGEEAALLRWAKASGIVARPLSIKGYGEEEAPAA